MSKTFTLGLVLAPVVVAVLLAIMWSFING